MFLPRRERFQVSFCSAAPAPKTPKRGWLWGYLTLNVPEPVCARNESGKSAAEVPSPAIGSARYTSVFLLAEQNIASPGRGGEGGGEGAKLLLAAEGRRKRRKQCCSHLG